MLQSLRNRFPDTDESREAEWRIKVRVKQRHPETRPALPGPLARRAAEVAQDADPSGHRPRGRALHLPGRPGPGRPPEGRPARRRGPAGEGRQGHGGHPFRPDLAGHPGRPGQGRRAGPRAVPGSLRRRPGRLGQPLGGDAKAQAIEVIPPEGPARQVPLAGAAALAPLPTGGVVAASDASRNLVFLDAQGLVRNTVPYGRDLPAPFKYVVALASDPLGHVAALVDGDFEGVALWGPDGALLRSATYKSPGALRQVQGHRRGPPGGADPGRPFQRPADPARLTMPTPRFLAFALALAALLAGTAPLRAQDPAAEGHLPAGQGRLGHPGGPGGRRRQVRHRPRRPGARRSETGPRVDPGALRNLQLDGHPGRPDRRQAGAAPRSTWKPRWTSTPISRSTGTSPTPGSRPPSTPCAPAGSGS